MGKKLKSNTKQGEVTNNETTANMGVSKKSIKIKKMRDSVTITHPKDELRRTGSIVEHEKNKKQSPRLYQGNPKGMPVMEVNQNVIDAVALPTSKKDKHLVGSVNITQMLKKKLNKENKPEVSVPETGSDDILKKVSKKKRKALEFIVGDVETPKKHKKKKASALNQPDESVKKNVTKGCVSKKGKWNAPVEKTEVLGEPLKKHKNKKKLEDHPYGTKSGSRVSVKMPKKLIDADADVVTSESESEDEQNDAFNEMDKVNQHILTQHSRADENESSGDDQVLQNTEEKTVKDKKEKRFTGPEHSIFIGNLPNTVKKSTMKSMFKQYGQIQSVRFRSNDGITLFKKKDRKEAKALNCYIRFETRKEAEAACVTNGQLVEGNRIRVTMHTQKQMGHVASTVFVGNINHKTTDNELYDFFSRVGELEYVRQIADKGIGYVCFKKGVSIAKALKLNQQLLNGRPLRIVKVDPAKQGKRKNKKGNLVDKATSFRTEGANSQLARPKNRRQDDQKQKTQVREFHGAVANAKSDNKRKQKKKGGSDQKKKLLGKKLTAASANRKQ